MGLTAETASWLAQLPMRCICREYPNKLDQVLSGPEDLKGPRELHPAFYGCFDWHSAVHGHWMLVKLLKLFELPEAPQIRAMLEENLSSANLEVETAFVLKNPSFERPYGWGWLLKLVEELWDWEDSDGKRWLDNLLPLSGAVTARFGEFLPKQTYPVRVGTHANTAFGMCFAWDFGRKICAESDSGRRHEPSPGYPLRGAGEMLELIRGRAHSYYLPDKGHSARLEPGGADFLSPCLVEADLMRRLLAPDEFAEWFHGFLPNLPSESTLLNPAIVADRRDPQIGHLDGLNISRAWCMEGIASVLQPDDPYKAILEDAGKRHRDEGLKHIATGDYLGEHWLASFAVYLLTRSA